MQDEGNAGRLAESAQVEAQLVPKDGPQLGLAGNASLVSKLDHLTRGLDIPLQGQPRSIDHDRWVTEGERLSDDGQVVYAQTSFVDHGDAAEMDADMVRRVPFADFAHDSRRAAALEVAPYPDAPSPPGQSSPCAPWPG